MSRAIVNQRSSSSSQDKIPLAAQLVHAQSPSSTKILTGACVAVAFLLPIKLSITYIVLTPSIIYWCYINRLAIRSMTIPAGAREIAAPLCAFLAVALLSGATGVSPLHSLPALASLLFFVLTVPVFAEYGHAPTVCLALVAGQTLAAFHSFIDAAVPNTIPGLFLGKVTESGQLAITIPVTLGLLLLGMQRDSCSYTRSDSSNCWQLPLCAVLITATITILGFQSELPLPTPLLAGATSIASACIYLAGTRSSRTTRDARLQTALLVCSLPLLTCALLVNLKRGPWLGECVGVGFLVLMYARRLIIPMALVAIGVAVSITPVRDRLLSSYSHFTIEGGRSTIWRIGAELLSEYPLGIGYHNSGVLREFAPEIPSELKHFHNNLLNIATETGWLGVAIFLWLLTIAIRCCFRDRRDPLYVAFGAALISWQVAGLVEYNFGDSEVTIMVWVLLGLIMHREIAQA
jgi:hypothetical protein